MDKRKVKDVFMEYVKGYDLTDPKIHLKVTHTLRVSGLAERIATESGFGKEEVSLAWLIGMLHDVGRFEQLRLYGTFNDAESIDHAKCGAEFLFAQGHIRDYIDETRYDSIIEKAIATHSLYRLPEDLSERELLHCNILRDADKIDILKVNVEESLESIYNVTPEEIAHAEVSPEVMEAFLERHAINHKLKKTVIDRSVGHAALAFELVFPVSIQIVQEQGYLQKILDFTSENPKTRKQYEVLRKNMNDFIKSACIL